MMQTLLIALSLSMDAFAVSVTAAACCERLTRFHMLRAAFAFGLFQFLMPLAGWFLGSAFSGIIGSFDHWIAFALLAIVGGKMLIEVIEEWREPADTCPTGEERKKLDLSSNRITLALAVATSIDALAVGVSYAVIGEGAIAPSVAIGVVTFLVCVSGFMFGRRVGRALGRYAQLAGGIVLVGIGARILISHLHGGV
jgi:manganese efflux pump family protein